MTIIAAADGSALGNPGPAGWAWYIDDSRWRCGGWKRGTNNQGELTAVLDLLRQTAHSPEPVHILCDSQYVINSVTKWMAGWKRKGWKKADGKPVLNVEVMKALDEAMRGREVTFEWVKGHAGHELNEKADALANGAARAHSSRQEPESGPGFPGARAVGAGDDPASPPTADGPARHSAAATSGTGPRAATTSRAPESRAPEFDLFSMEDETPSAADRPAVDLVVDLERSLLTDAVRGDRAHLEALLDPSWSHVCARGEVWSRGDRLAAAESPDTATGERTMEVLEARELGSDAILLVWRERTGGGSLLRSSVWVRSRGSWRQTFQQGTPEA
ncbi:ribonuclease HI family protein [Dietzia sp. PP-33]|uniref:ribonuclease HI family protein n=1 Tax=Dietzia sp. PP-33 TaxID=2957500 RepID=UPI0029B9D514|nr:ribonuclease HI family protein [Dietzia sp. PP-33]MDX2356727.1 ribonuclease HI family protein [Dietzia sp. PP-33]